MKDDDFKLLRGFVTDERTNEWTFVNVESLSRLKSISNRKFLHFMYLNISLPSSKDYNLHHHYFHPQNLHQLYHTELSQYIPTHQTHQSNL